MILNDVDCAPVPCRMVRFLTGVNMSKTRAPPSGADPSNLVEKRIDTEDDVLHIQVTPQLTCTRTSFWCCLKPGSIADGIRNSVT